MGECLIIRRGGESYKLPVLDANYPKDVNKTIVAGDNASVSFDVIISEAGNPAFYTYQWYDNGVAVKGATDSSYVKTNINDSMSCNIYCVVSNKAGSVMSRVASLNVGKYYTPVLDGNYPLNDTVEIQNSVVCQVRIATDGNPSNYTYQWYKNNIAINGAINSSYIFTPTELGDVEIYCIVTNSAGTVKSRIATITAIPVYLYTNGDTCDIVTGGWVGTNAAQITFNSTNMTLTSSGNSKVYTKNKIDLTNTDHLLFEGTLATSTTPAHRSLCVFADTPSSNDYSNLVAYYNTSVTDGTCKLDVSALSGKYHVGFAIRDDTTIVKSLKVVNK